MQKPFTSILGDLLQWGDSHPHHPDMEKIARIEDLTENQIRRLWKKLCKGHKMHQ